MPGPGTRSWRRCCLSVRDQRAGGTTSSTVQIQPFSDDGQQVVEGKIIWLELEEVGDDGKLISKGSEPFLNSLATRNRRFGLLILEPVPDAADGTQGVTIVGNGILTRDVGAEFLVPVAFPIENQAALSLLAAGTETTSTEKDSQLERHVETWKVMGLVELAQRKVSRYESSNGQLMKTDVSYLDKLRGSPRMVSGPFQIDGLGCHRSHLLAE